MRRCLQSSQLHMVTCDFASPHPAILYFVGALEALWILRGPLYFGGSSVRASMKWRMHMVVSKVGFTTFRFPTSKRAGRSCDSATLYSAIVCGARARRQPHQSNIAQCLAHTAPTKRKHVSSSVCLQLSTRPKNLHHCRDCVAVVRRIHDMLSGTNHVMRQRHICDICHIQDAVARLRRQHTPL